MSRRGRARGYLTHLVGPKQRGQLARTACGVSVSAAFRSDDPDRVQCGNCKRTEEYRNAMVMMAKSGPAASLRAFNAALKRSGLRDIGKLVIPLALLVTSGCAITIEDAPPREPAPRTAAAAAIADAWVARVLRKPNDHRRLREHREAKRRARRHVRDD